MKIQPLGPRQEAWLKYLEENPKLQGKLRLGFFKTKTKKPIELCCLGAAEYLYCQKENKEVSLSEDYTKGVSTLISPSGESLSDAVLTTDTVEYYGFYSNDGEKRFKNGNSSKRRALTVLNDGGLSWPEIAAIIRKNPIYYFSKPL